MFQGYRTSNRGCKSEIWNKQNKTKRQQQKETSNISLHKHLGLDLLKFYNISQSCKAL